LTPTPTPRTKADWARLLAEQGFDVFQLKPGTKLPKGKWQDDATSDLGMIGAWWRGSPESNIGIATGSRSGILVLDLDNKPDANGADSIKAAGITLPRTKVVRTPSGGYHVYMAYPEGSGITIGTGLLPGVDWRGDGGYVVGPGSVLDKRSGLEPARWGEYTIVRGVA
jgi:hypothetical protein